MKTLFIALLSLFTAMTLAFGAVAMLSTHYDVGGAAYVAAEYQGFGSLATGQRSGAAADRPAEVEPPAKSVPASSAANHVPVATRSA
jgi:hypothetical protein